MKNIYSKENRFSNKSFIYKRMEPKVETMRARWLSLCLQSEEIMNSEQYGTLQTLLSYCLRYSVIDAVVKIFCHLNNTTLGIAP